MFKALEELKELNRLVNKINMEILEGHLSLDNKLFAKRKEAEDTMNAMSYALVPKIASFSAAGVDMSEIDYGGVLFQAGILRTRESLNHPKNKDLVAEVLDWQRFELLTNKGRKKKFPRKERKMGNMHLAQPKKKSIAPNKRRDDNTMFTGLSLPSLDLSFEKPKGE